MSEMITVSISDNTKTSSSRIESVDILRGFALVGILMANILWYSGFLDSPAQFRNENLNITYLDHTLLFLTRLFIHGKFFHIYSFLFGLGFFLLYSSPTLKNQGFSRYFIKRQTILFMIGCIHAFFIWWGDILRYYALLGILILLLKDLPLRQILFISIALLAMPVLLSLAEFTGLLKVDISLSENIEKSALFELYLHGGWFDANLIRLINGLESNINTGRLFRIFGMFTLGYYFGKIGFFKSTLKATGLQKNLILFSVLIALPIGLLKTGAKYFDYSLGLAIKPVVMEFLYTLSVTGMSLGYIALIALIAESIQHRRVGKILITLGRLPLTNYLLQSLMGFVIFHILGLFASLTLTETYLLAFFIIVIQVWFSSSWLKYKNIGPIEGLWRDLLKRWA